MKVILNKFYFLVVFFGGAMSIFSQPPTPTPVPPPPPGLPINEHVCILFLAALLYGFYTLYNRQTKTKPSI
jgi:hypothetical protein